VELVNPFLTAMVADRFAAARAEAARADALVASSPDPSLLPPFLGVPFVIKECMEFPGMPYTMGLVQVKGRWGGVRVRTTIN
jgi:Asp-tRNA(Asn)/Glu-tRNA(Gln) amidotransferase A subunit family amidase